MRLSFSVSITESILENQETAPRSNPGPGALALARRFRFQDLQIHGGHWHTEQTRAGEPLCPRHTLEKGVSGCEFSVSIPVWRR